MIPIPRMTVIEWALLAVVICTPVVLVGVLVALVWEVWP